MTRNRASAKQAGAKTKNGNGSCFSCGCTIALNKNNRYPKYCSNACINAARSARRKETRPPVERVYQPLEERLMSRVQKTSTCWIFTGSNNNKGYGLIRIDETSRKTMLAHRASYELFNGPIDEGLIIRHRCDNPPCVNPDHLETGGYSENMMDSITRGRYPVGERSGEAKLTSAQVAEIRSRYRRWPPANGGRVWRSNAPELAAEFGVNRRHIGAICMGKERKHDGQQAA